MRGPPWRAKPPLHYAAAFGNTPEAKLLIDAGADIRAKTKSGFTPLHSAAISSATEIAAMLIERGAEVGATTEDGWTPPAFGAGLDGGKIAGNCAIAD